MQSFQYSAYNPYVQAQAQGAGSFGPPPPGLLAPHPHPHLPAQSFIGSTGPTAAAATPTAATPAWTKQLEQANLNRQSGTTFYHSLQAKTLGRTQNSNQALAIVDPKEKDVPTTKQKSSANGNGPHKADAPAPLLHQDSNVVPKKAPESTEPTECWTALDMGGVGFNTVSPALFRFSFLTTLYLCHNHLSVIPSAISNLKALVKLDLSSNKIATVPPELGTLMNLKQCFLFDNQIVTLPPELGTLCALETLGVEGNPLQDSLRAIIEKEGTSSLIQFLRDSCPVPLPPPDREWIALATDQQLPLEDSFTVLCYNILCEKAATGQMYGYTPSWALSWEYRKELVLQELLGYAPDIISLQEVDVDQYGEYFLHNLNQHDYEGVYWPRSRARTMSDEEKRHVDGCAIFYKSSTFTLIEQQSIEFNSIALRRPDFQKCEAMFNRVQGRDHVAAVALLEHKHTGARVIVANAHIFWNPEFKDVKLVQTALLMSELHHIVDRFGKLPPRFDLPNAPRYSQENRVPVILCGDFNSTPDSGVYQFLDKGYLAPDHVDFNGFKYGNLTTDGLEHSLALKSSYGSVGELPLTNHTPEFSGVIDYIWYSSASLQVTALLGEVDKEYLNRTVGFPNAHYPSDHIAILAELRHKHHAGS